ncbi:uncharacterized protein L969DRAFT_46250 [Mixia osmundae IAM 14324]|uniref:SGT1-domain-containing protein n=1 Tax=Mixia osmundae (strain CBS 9802 / IAM 14324 / JCM 22182 / KY 12970) TaxID=764103 RepID=G7E587_MIXOS|nr:uncharacterized protein L969DRAFT_46250 [Mixia osmundae IAM 14324]KEI40853.1 hypothetical protein L969DRAFT_46250 [Mixia osmundae IAM 14324]GAA97997.1 hypothetical protein E5Q_04677 [Mixia osmundae IAM 14324]
MATTLEGLKKEFAESEGLPQSLASEDTVFYSLHWLPSNSNSGHDDDGTIWQLKLLAVISWAEKESQANGWIWHKDSFQLAICSDLVTTEHATAVHPQETALASASTAPSCSNLSQGSSYRYLSGQTRIGSSLFDEYYLLYLLHKLSVAKFGDGQWAITITDQDGQFMLIDAAEAGLPKWVKPEVMDGRVWIVKGEIHLVPLMHPIPHDGKGKERAQDNVIMPWQALAVIVDPLLPSRAPRSVEREIFSHIANFPDRILKEHLHTTSAYLPTRLAQVFAQGPDFVALASNTFYGREPIGQEARWLERMQHLPPDSMPGLSRSASLPESVQLCKIQMTRPLFAQLVCQQFDAPAVFASRGWSPTVAKPNAAQVQELRRREVGMKLTCGFELVLQRAQKLMDEHPISYAVGESSMQSWQQAISVSDHATSTLLMRRARRLQLFANSDATDILSEIDDALLCDASELFASSTSTRVALTTDSLAETPESWLDVDPEGLEALLASKLAGRTGGDEDGVDEDEVLANAQAERLTGMAEKLHAFMDGKGGADGAELDDEMSDDEEELSDSEEEDPPYKNDPELLIPPLPDGEWGQKSGPVKAKPDAIMQEQIAEPVTKKRAVYSDESDEDEAEDQDLEDIKFTGSQWNDDEDDIAMEGELDDFLEFTRQALGLSDAEYKDIIATRQRNGAHVPTQPSAPSRPPQRQPPKRTVNSQAQTQAKSNGEPAKNANLATFDDVMDAMDAHLASARKPKPAPVQSDSEEEESEDEMMAMDRELAKHLKTEVKGKGQGQEEYAMIQNFLESFKSQGGLSGPASNLLGRLDPTFVMPRDHE